ncbi:MAG: superinfection immunity protein [Mycobacteriales bacterium]
MPLIVAAVRKHNVVGVAIVNVQLAWTVIGWIIAPVMAYGAQREPVTVIQQ